MGTFLDVSWHAQAACREVDMDWYPETPDGQKTIQDVADYMGLNEATVRRALLDYDRVADEVKDRVYDAVEEVGYRPDPSRDPRYTESLRLICSGCPVKSDCLEHALRFEHHGFWGGTSPHERRELRKKLNIVVTDPIYEVARESS